MPSRSAAGAGKKVGLRADALEPRISPHAVAPRSPARRPGRAGARFPNACAPFPDQIDLVMLHVLTRGGPDELRWLVSRLGDATIRRWILRRRGRGLMVRQMTPWVTERTARRWQAHDEYALIWEKSVTDARY